MTEPPKTAPPPPPPDDDPAAAAEAEAQAEAERAADARADRGFSEFVRRAVSAGVGAASRSKDDIMRVAAAEMKSWLERLDFNNEVIRALSKMVIEVKTEIRFRPTEDGRLVPQATNDVSVKGKG